jgi:hypothetical protein
MLNGACMCGKVQYEIAAKPRFMYQCFCGKCRAASGASFVTNIIVEEGLREKRRLEAKENS